MAVTKKQQKEFNKIRVKLGNPIYPSEEACTDIFNKRNATSSFYWVYNLKEDRVTYRKGVYEHLGYPDDFELNMSSMSQFIPQDGRKFFEAQIIAAYKVLLEVEPKEILKQGLISFESNKTILDRNGNEVYIYQSSEPFQFDKNGNMVSNISWYHIQEGYKISKKFQGGGFVSRKRVLELQQSDKFDKSTLINCLKNFNEAQSKLVDYKIDLIDGFPLTKTEQLVISKFAAISDKKLLEKEKVNLVAEMINVKPKTIQVHKDNINKKRSFFGDLKDFNSLIEFLENENLIKY